MPQRAPRAASCRRRSAPRKFVQYQRMLTVVEQIVAAAECGVARGVEDPARSSRRRAPRPRASARPRVAPGDQSARAPDWRRPNRRRARCAAPSMRAPRPPASHEGDRRQHVVERRRERDARARGGSRSRAPAQPDATARLRIVPSWVSIEPKVQPPPWTKTMSGVSGALGRAIEPGAHRPCVPGDGRAPRAAIAGAPSLQGIEPASMSRRASAIGIVLKSTAGAARRRSRIDLPSAGRRTAFTGARSVARRSCRYAAPIACGEALAVARGEALERARRGARGLEERPPVAGRPQLRAVGVQRAAGRGSAPAPRARTAGRSPGGTPCRARSARRLVLIGAASSIASDSCSQASRARRSVAWRGGLEAPRGSRCGGGAPGSPRPPRRSRRVTVVPAMAGPGHEAVLLQAQQRLADRALAAADLPGEPELGQRRCRARARSS